MPMIVVRKKVLQTTKTNRIDKNSKNSKNGNKDENWGINLAYLIPHHFQKTIYIFDVKLKN